MKTSQLFTFLLIASVATPCGAAAPTLMSGLKGAARIALCAALVTPPACVAVRACTTEDTQEPWKQATQDFLEIAPEMLSDAYAPAEPYVEAFYNALPQPDWRPTSDPVQNGFTE